MKTTTRSNVISVEEARLRTADIPEAWRKARGLLKGRTRLDPVAIQRRMRTDWGKRLRRQIKLGRKKHAA